jgi:hypothetical protein
MTAIAFKEGTSFNGKCFVKNIALDMACRAKLDAAPTNATHHTATDHNILSHNFACDMGLLTNRYG